MRRPQLRRSGIRRIRMRTRFGTSLVLAFVLALLASLAPPGVVAPAAAPRRSTRAASAEAQHPGNPDGSGTATITPAPETGEACWDLSSEGIGAVGQSHIHVGAAGESGDVLI